MASLSKCNTASVDPLLITLLLQNIPVQIYSLNVNWKGC